MITYDCPPIDIELGFYVICFACGVLAREMFIIIYGMLGVRT
jgi:hypothetical protein